MRNEENFLFYFKILATLGIGSCVLYIAYRRLYPNSSSFSFFATQKKDLLLDINGTLNAVRTDVVYDKFYFLPYTGGPNSIRIPTAFNRKNFQAILETIKNRDLANKMVTFYVVQDRYVGISKIYLSISGEYTDAIRATVNQKISSMNWDGTKPKIECVPSQPALLLVLSQNTDGDENYSETIFARILQELTTKINATDQTALNKLEILKNSFNLSQDDINKIKLVASLLKGNLPQIDIKHWQQQYIENYKFLYKKDICQRDYAKNIMLFTINLFLPWGESSHVRYVFPSTYPNGNQEINKLRSQEEYRNIFEAIKNLRDKFFSFSKNDIAKLLGHCAEDNMFAYLKENVDILNMPGKHYIFSAKITENTDFVSDFCEVCYESFSDKFQSVLLHSNYQHSNSFTERVMEAMCAVYRNEPLSKPISAVTGIPTSLVKFGLFAITTAAVYYGRDYLPVSSKTFG